MYYVLLVVSCLIILYFILNYGSQFVLNNKINKNNIKIYSVIFISVLEIIIFIIMYQIRDPWLQNRFQHAFAGGFIAMITTFLAFKDSKIKINKIQTIILSILIVTSLGVINELLEFLLQNITTLVFNNSINDTWLDLSSNTFGIIIASVSYTLYFLLFKKHEKKK